MKLNKDELFRKPLIMLKIMGYYSSYGNSFKGNLLKIYANTLFTAITISTVFQTHFLLMNIQHIERVIDTIAPYTQSLFLIIKLSSFYWQRGKFQDLMMNIAKYSNEREIFETPFYQNSIKVCHKIFNFFVSMGSFTAFLMMSKSLVATVFAAKREFPYPLSFFFDLKQSPIFEIVYGNAILGPVRNVLGTVGTDGLFIYSGYYLLAHIQNLKLKIEIEGKICKKQQLADIIQYHNQIIDCFETFNKIFFPILVGQFCLIVSQICVLGFQIIMAKEAMKRIFSLAFLMMSLFGLFQYNFIATKIANESESIADAIYNVYLDSNLNFKKDLMLMMMRAQKPLVVKAGFYRLTLDMFAKFVNSALSYMTLLKSIAAD